MSKKRILHISKFYHPYYGGIEDVVYTIVNELKGDYEQRVICFNHERGFVRSMDNGIEIIRVNAPVSIASQPCSLSFLWKLQHEINSFRPDIIHIHFPNPLVAAYLLMVNTHGAKIVVHWHADIIGKKAMYTFVKPIEHKVLKRAYRIVATSKQYIAKSTPLQPFLDKIVIIPNTINESKLQFFKGEEKKINAIRDRYIGKKIVFFVGRHVNYKGVDYLIAAASQLPDDCVVLIGGTGVETENLRHLAKPLGDKVRFLGRLPNNEMKYYLCAATVFAFPSIDRREAFGVALAEALYCGTPAVSFYIDGSGTTWVNQHEKTGLVVQDKDADHYAQAIKKLLSDDELCKQYGDNAAEWVRAHFLKNQISQLTTIYQ